MGTLALSKEGLFIMSVATVRPFLFFSKPVFDAKNMTGRVHKKASAGRTTTGQCGATHLRQLSRHGYVVPHFVLTLALQFLARTTEQYQEFMFLKETIPTPVSLSEALQLRELHEKEMLEDDPALAAPTALSATVGHTPSTSKPKVKKAAANGKDKQNRQGSSSSRGPSQVRWDYEDTPLSNDHNLAAQTIRGGRESGWTRWPNGQNFMAADPLTQHNGYSALAHQPPIPSANGHASAAPRPETAPHPQVRLRVRVPYLFC
jgi:hypothetical protein